MYKDMSCKNNLTFLIITSHVNKCLSYYINNITKAFYRFHSRGFPFFNLFQRLSIRRFIDTKNKT